MRKPIGIIQVPIDAFNFLPGVGRDLHSATVDKLAHLFRRVRCRPKKWEHHVKGLVDFRTYYEILTALNFSRQQLQETVTRGPTYHKVSLPPKSIICIQGKHRLAAASREFGERYFWTVRLYYPTGMYDTELPDKRANMLQTKMTPF